MATAILLALTGTIPSQTYAAGTVGVEEVLVTARKVEESLQDTPIAVTAFSAASLEQRSSSNLADVSQYSPNVQFQQAAPLSGGSFNSTVFIRGIGQNDFAVFSDPGVGVYLDGVYLARSTGSVLDLVDVERVEILRGPQGTLFGKNAVGGAISLVSKRPSQTWEGNLEATIGEFERRDFKGTISGPITDMLAFRLSAAHLEREGYVDRIQVGDELGGQDSSVGRVQFELTPSDTLRINLAADGTRTRQDSAASTLLRVDQIGLVNAFNAATGATVSPRWITGDPYKTNATGTNANDLDLWGVSATVDWEAAANTQLKSITAYRTFDSFFARDGDNTPFPFRHTADYVDQEQFSQELQLTGSYLDNRLKLVSGLYYLHEKATDDAEITLAKGVVPPNLFFNQFNSIKTDSYAAYSQASYELTDALNLNAGLRYTYEDKEFEVYERRCNPALTGNCISNSDILINSYIVDPTILALDPSVNPLGKGEYPLQKSWNDLSPRIGLDYKITPDMMAYTSVSKGFKSGSFNGRATFNESNIQPFDPEIVWNYEVGLKSSWFDRRLIVNGALFWMDYKDIQVTINATPDNFVLNAASADIAGAELEFQAAPIEGLRFDGSIGYLDAQYGSLSKSVQLNNGTSVTVDSLLGDDLVRTPEWTANLGGDYTVDLASFGSLTFRADWKYTSEMYFDAANTPLLRQGGFSLLNARITYAPVDSHWEVAAFVTNISDKVYLSSGNAASASFGNITEGTYGRPREWGLTAKIRM